MTTRSIFVFPSLLDVRAAAFVFVPNQVVATRFEHVCPLDYVVLSSESQQPKAPAAYAAVDTDLRHRRTGITARPSTRHPHHSLNPRWP